MMMHIRRRESSQEHRRIPFAAPPGLLFYAVYVTSNARVPWHSATGVIVEIGDGHYYYEPPRDEIDLVGTVTYRAHYTDGMGQQQVWFTCTVMPSDEHDDPQPPVWFTT